MKIRISEIETNNILVLSLITIFSISCSITDVANSKVEKNKNKNSYSELLKEDPNAGGNILLLLNVSPSGKVDNIEILEDSINNDKLRQIILRVVKKLNFGKRDKNVLIEYPLKFIPNQEVF